MLLGATAMLSAQNNQLPPVGKIQQNGETKVFYKNLVKQFKKGGQITQFKIIKLKDGFNLIRRGKDVNGEGRTEVIALEMKAGGFVFVPHEIKWFTVCNPTCPNADFCTPNYDKTACNCIGSGANCNFGIDGGIMGYEVVIIAP